jgi:hypothetical protein
MLRDFALLDLLSERCTISGTVTTCATDFLCTFGHVAEIGLTLVLMVMVVGKFEKP